MKSAEATTAAPAGVAAVSREGLSCRAAADADAEAISELLQEGSRAGLTLPRRPSEIRAHLGEFVVGERVGGGGGAVLSCGALQPVCPGLGEIRSICVSPEAAGLGLGRMMMEHLTARETGTPAALTTLVLLTKIPAFFERFGFERLRMDEVPTAFRQKVLLTPGRSFRDRVAMTRGPRA